MINSHANSYVIAMFNLKFWFYHVTRYQHLVYLPSYATDITLPAFLSFSAGIIMFSPSIKLPAKYHIERSHSAEL